MAVICPPGSHPVCGIKSGGRVEIVSTDLLNLLGIVLLHRLTKLRSSGTAVEDFVGAPDTGVEPFKPTDGAGTDADGFAACRIGQKSVLGML